MSLGCSVEICFLSSCTEEGFLKVFIESTKSLSPEEKGAKLEADEVRRFPSHSCYVDQHTQGTTRRDLLQELVPAICKQRGHKGTIFPATS